MTQANPNPQDPKQQDPKQKEELESFALAYDPKREPLRERMTCPLPPLPKRQSPPSPILWVLGAGLILGGLVLFVWLLSLEGDNPPRSQDLAPRSLSVYCEFEVETRSPVLSRPAEDATILWWLEAGETRRAFERLNTAWLRLDRGWVAWEGLRLDSALNSDCANLILAENVSQLDDELALPPALDGLSWELVLNADFADGLAGWEAEINADGIGLFEGNLVIYAAEGANLTWIAAPSEAFNPTASFYVTMAGRWLASDATTAFWLELDLGEGVAYRLRFGRDGQVGLWWRYENENDSGQHILTETFERSLANAEYFRLGVGIFDDALRVYVDEQERLSHAPLEAGLLRGLGLALEGRNSTLYVDRVTVLAPTSDE